MKKQDFKTKQQEEETTLHRSLNLKDEPDVDDRGGVTGSNVQFVLNCNKHFGLFFLFVCLFF